MFSVVGLIGMAGIIINDSIVLVTAIDRRLPTTDMVTAIVDGMANVCGRFFSPPSPRLAGWDRSCLNKAVRRLMITPTMIAIQHDVGLRLRSLRRLLRLAASRRKRRPAGR